MNLEKKNINNMFLRVLNMLISNFPLILVWKEKQKPDQTFLIFSNFN